MKQLSVKPVGFFDVQDEKTCIKLYPEYSSCLTALEGFNYINVLWWFSDFDTEDMRSIFEVDKPYKKSPEKMGVFATRAPIRPNPIGLTAVQIISIDSKKGIIDIAWTDAHNGSPILDIKPYTPSFDRVGESLVPQWCSHWPLCVEESGNFNWENEFNF